MRIVKIFFLVVLAYFLIGNGSAAYAVNRPDRPPFPVAKKAKAKARAQHINYMEEHDLNNDGKVDNRDRHIWARRNENTVLQSYDDSDAYFLGEIDDNGDGEVSKKELNVWMIAHDSNVDGRVGNDEL